MKYMGVVAIIRDISILWRVDDTAVWITITDLRRIHNHMKKESSIVTL